jgi:hypothetical protein
VLITIAPIIGSGVAQAWHCLLRRHLRLPDLRFINQKRSLRFWAHVLMPWSAKLLLAAALTLPTVKATAAAVSRDRFWNRVQPHGWPRHFY